MSNDLIVPDDGHGSVPPANRPGHHPDHEQDRPQVSPDVWRLRHGDVHTIPFRFDGTAGAAARLFGVRPDRDGLHLGRDRIAISYGPWRLDTTLGNLESVAITGPYWLPKVAGPPHVSFGDHGVSFATTTRLGLCLRFVEPVSAALPLGLLRHPGATVTVEGPERVAVALLDHLSDVASAA